jgi:hypothetical protein
MGFLGVAPAHILLSPPVAPRPERRRVIAPPRKPSSALRDLEEFGEGEDPRAGAAAFAEDAKDAGLSQFAEEQEDGLAAGLVAGAEAEVGDLEDGSSEELIQEGHRVPNSDSMDLRCPFACEHPPRR